MELERSFASRDRDQNDLASFACWDGNPESPWVEEAENYIRGWALSNAQHVLTFRDEQGLLVAVTAFDERIISVPRVAPIEHNGWHFQVAAVSLEHQGRGLSNQILTATLAAMHELDEQRVLVTAHAHREHHLSLKACERVGLSKYLPLDDHYWILLGEIPSPRS
jgi:RimJ/RimL family protein N-acetyltransferase